MSFSTIVVLICTTRLALPCDTRHVCYDHAYAQRIGFLVGHLKLNSPTDVWELSAIHGPDAEFGLGGKKYGYR
jgi:hypothetical protein